MQATITGAALHHVTGFEASLLRLLNIGELFSLLCAHIAYLY